jgi:hypothetical protein
MLLKLLRLAYEVKIADTLEVIDTGLSYDFKFSAKSCD